MNDHLHIREETALGFFGKMSASISHEIKNVLAIINENAGLLEDYNLMAEKGTPLNPERIKTLAKTVMMQIKRADGIVKNMNKFAHSVDEATRVVDVREVLELVAALSSRLAAMRGVVIDLQPSSSAVSILSSPFFLENLIWLVLDFAMDAVGKGKRVGLIAENKGEGARIRFTQLDALGIAQKDEFPTERERSLLHILNAEIALDHGAGQILMDLPANIHL
jgi:C4-dicarboxylate-specific signal transduction histidine kinase